MLSKKQIQQLDRWNQWNIWFHYLLVQLSLKYNFVVKRVSEDNTGWGPPDKIVGNLEFRYIWSDIRYMDFDEFITTKKGMSDPEYLPIWEWYWRFKDEIQINGLPDSFNSL